MIYFTDAEIDQIISEDVPYYDLTSISVKFGTKVARISFTTKHDTVICGTEEVLKIFEKFHISPTLISVSGEVIQGGIKFLEAEGLASNIHSIRHTAANLIEYSSGIATRTRELIKAAQTISPEIQILTARKSIPFTKKLSVKSIHIGGGFVHRLGLSDTILINDNHIKFSGGIDSFIRKLPEIKKRSHGRHITVEVNNTDDAIQLTKSGVDALQIDSIPAKELQPLVKKIREINADLIIAASGNINLSNVTDFAQSGVNLLVTSWPYYGNPADFYVNIEPSYDF